MGLCGLAVVVVVVGVGIATERQLEHFFKADPEYGRRVRDGLAKHWAAPRAKL